MYKVHRAVLLIFRTNVSCTSIKNSIAYANEVNIINKDSRIIVAFDFHKFLRSDEKNIW